MIIHSASKNTPYFSCDPLLFWQLKEEEAKKLRASLEQQQQEAKHREEELHLEALEKVL